MCEYHGFKLDVIGDERGVRVYLKDVGETDPISTFTGANALMIKSILFGEIQFYNISSVDGETKVEVVHRYKKPYESFDPISHPSHYTEGRQYEPRKVIEDWDLGFYLGNVVKYISRAGRKEDMLEDLRKARQYLDWEIEKWTKS